MLLPEDAIERISNAVPGNFFPADPDAARKLYRELSRLVHPDANPGNAEAAEAFKTLSELWAQYNNPPSPVIHGAIADLFPQSGGLLKLVRDPRDNDLMVRECAALKALRSPGVTLPEFLPKLLASCRQKDPATGIIRRAHLIEPLDGFYTCAQVREAYPNGINPRDAAWIFRRLLTVLGHAHRNGFIHGAVLPEHIMIHPESHGLVLIDWCYSCARSQLIPAMVKDRRSFYAPEVFNKEVPGPDTDIYMAARSLGYLMGGSVIRQLKAFCAGCTMAYRPHRPDDAWNLLVEFDELLERIFGPRKFHEFTMPV